MIEAWPVNPPSVQRIGQGVLTDRGNGKPHNGVDIFVPNGTPVVAPVSGVVIRVVDGRNTGDESREKAGLWIDLEEPARKIGENRRIHRFLHLGSAGVKGNQKVSVGDNIGTVAEPNTSGLGDESHLHYEIRKTSGNQAYGNPIDPKFDLADAVAAHAWKTIPKIAHIAGIERYGDPRYIKVAQSVRRVWDEKDPDKRLELAHEADEVSKHEGARGYWDAAKEGASDAVDKKIVNPGKEAIKGAAKEMFSWWGDLSTGWKIGIVAGGLAASAAVIKTIID